MGCSGLTVHPVRVHNADHDLETIWTEKETTMSANFGPYDANTYSHTNWHFKIDKNMAEFPDARIFFRQEIVHGHVIRRLRTLILLLPMRSGKRWESILSKRCFKIDD